MFNRSDAGDNDSDKSSAPPARPSCCRCFRCCDPCFGFMCIPCTRIRNSACCQRCRRDKSPKTTESSSAAETTSNENRKKFCGCCRRSRSTSTEPQVSPAVASMAESSSMAAPKEPGKCSLCLSKFLCCRRTNKVEQTSGSSVMDSSSPAKRKCCFCIPCGRKQPENVAWQETRRESILSEPQKR